MTDRVVQIAEEIAAHDIRRPRLSGAQLEALYARTDLWPALYLAATLACITGLLALAVSLPHPVVLVGVFVLIGALQQHLSIIHHEAVHYLLFRSRRLNDAVGSAVAFTIGFSMGYRTHHLTHHRRVGHDDDPDLDAYAAYPTTPAKFVGDLFVHLSGFGAVSQFRQQIQRVGEAAKTGEATGPGQFVGIVATQLLLLGLFSAAGHPLLYFGLWVLPLVTVAKTLTHFRGVCEHTVALRQDGRPTRYRTIECGPIERFFFAPMNFNFHAEHHFYPAIPYYNLPAAFRALSNDPAYRESVRVDRGYIGFLFRQAIRSR
jgi:fatty acid desaturase